MSVAVCRKPTSGYPCPMCGRFVCSEPCLDEHAIVHIRAAGATEEEVSLAIAFYARISAVDDEETALWAAEATLDPGRPVK